MININKTHGIPIQIASLTRTFCPHSLKKFSTPIGDTFIGRQGRKYLELSQGEKKAQPRPPLVMASKTPCRAVQRLK